jgi:hypothetical protein
MHGYFDIDAKVILPIVKISHEKKTKMSHFLKIYHENKTYLENLPRNKIFSENLPFYGNISMEIGTLGLLLCINGGIYRMLSKQVNIGNVSNCPSG